MNLSSLTIIISLSLLLPNYILLAQSALVYNNGAHWHLNPGAYVIVKTNSVENADGIIDNAGTFRIEEHFINRDTATGNNSILGHYQIGGDWLNFSSFIADQSLVTLDGTNQIIGGNAISNFYNLTLEGTGIKRQEINSEVRNILNLNDLELATDSFEMLISNTDTNAIQRRSGFVSSLGSGRLTRTMNQDLPYLFPVGSRVGTFRYRPVEIKPNTFSNESFGVRLANVNAGQEGYDITTKNDLICAVNPDYFHRIYRNTSSIPDMKFYYDVISDGVWSETAHWRGLPEWHPVNSTTGFSSMDFVEAIAVDDFSSPAFALSIPAIDFELMEDTTIAIGESVQIRGQFNTNITTFEWEPSDFLTCTDCNNPISEQPDREMIYVLKANPGSACEAKDTVRIFLRDEALIYLPSAFSPNGDGLNDIFRVLGTVDQIERMNFMIFNRWGEKVFESTNPSIGWDGMYKGQLQDMAVFSFYLKATLSSIDESIELTGNVTLLAY